MTTRTRSLLVSIPLLMMLGGCPAEPVAMTDAGPPPTDTGPGDDAGPGTDAGPGDDAGPGTDAGPAATPSCTAYCAAITANCTGANAQYTDLASCLANCDAFPVGTAADMSGNTLGCRTYHAGAAAGAGATTHCSHAGPSGDGVCGTNCEGYCNLALANCTGADELYADAAACATACGAITDDVTYTTAATAGDSLACRIYHLSAAATDATSATLHCPHGEDPSAICM